ncbi:MAG: PAS domain-containing protein [Desulfobulbaceae bacterium]|nr:MAG: PAS domain-containing protein [Desulfobulbaceae bacterium]
MHRTQSDLLLELDQRLRFEKLLVDISARFINLPAEQVDDAIEDALRQICDRLGFDMSSLWQCTGDEHQEMRLTHLFGPPEGPHPSADIDAVGMFPWIYQQMMGGRTLNILTEQLPPEAARDQESRRAYGIKSAVNIPLSAGGGPVVGVLTFNCLSRERLVTDEEVRRLGLVAQMLANVLVRKKMEETLLKNEERLSLAIDSAEAGIWEYDCSEEVFWVNRRTAEIFGFPPGEQASWASIQALIHPDDLEMVRQALADAASVEGTTRVEYRIRKEPEGEIWLLSSGRPCFDQHGHATRVLGMSVDISRRKSLENEIKQRLGELENLRQRLEEENWYLREDLRAEKGFEQIVGRSKALHRVLAKAGQVAETDSTVLILGETGTGKGLLANAIHQMSPRRKKSFVTVNCAALPQNLVESELFGREKGAFTGAHARQIGRFEIADGGTIFLDEIGELPLELQSKLLRVLQEGEFERLGSPKTVRIDVRVIAATGKVLLEEVRNRRFREDLYYRLNVFPLTIPPLRERSEDIPLLVNHFVQKFAGRMGKRIETIPKAVLGRMLQYGWPGNIRELEHLVERSVIISPGSTLVLGDQLQQGSSAAAGTDTERDLASIERRHITRILHEVGWKIDGPGGAALILGINPSTLRFRMKKLGIVRPL